MATLDKQGRAAALARIRELVAIRDEIGSQTDPSPAVNKASYAQEAALVKRDGEVSKLARQLVETRDVSAAAALLNEVRTNVGRPVASALAMALAGVTEKSVGLPKLDSAAPGEVLAGLARFFESHQPPDAWCEGPLYLNPLTAAFPNFWRAGLVAILLSDRENAARRLGPLLSPESVDRTGTEMRFRAVLNYVRFLKRPPEVDEVVIESVWELFRTKKLNSLQRQVGFDTLIAYYREPGHESKLAHLLELDHDPAMLTWLFGNLTVVSPANRKRILPAVEAVAEWLRGDPTGLARLKLVDAAMGLKGLLLEGDPKKKRKLPKAPPRVKFSGTVGTEGGPILVIPKAAASEWAGVLRADGTVPADGDFRGTDYQRACDIDGVGFIKVGKHQALVLGNQGCDIVLPKEGGCLLVLAGDEEEVFAALEAGPKWRRLRESLSSTGELLLFDSAMERAKTENKRSLKLKAGRYAVEHLGDVNHSPWIVRVVAA